MSQPDERGAPMPLTLPQLDFWEEFTFHPDEPIATVAHCLEIDGVVDEAILAEAITRAVAESDALSVRFHLIPGRATPLQSCDPALRPALQRLDLRSAADPLAEARTRMEADLAAPLDLRGEGLAALWLVRIGAARYLWYIRAHHINLDGYGLALIERRCGRLYAQAVGQGEAGPPFHRLASFIAEEEAYRAGPRHAADAAYWRDYLAGPVALPVLHRGDRDFSGPPHAAEGAFPEAFSQALRRLSARTGIGWPDLLVLISGLYLSDSLPRQRVEGGEVVSFWLPFMSRWGSVAAHMPGMLVNILPFTLSIAPGEELGGFLRRNATALKAQRRHGRYRIEQIAADHGLPGGSRYFFSPLINVLPFSEPVFPGCRVTRHVMANGEPEGIDLTFRGRDDGGALSFGLSADATLFGEEAFARHRLGLPAFLEAATAPDALTRPVAAVLGRPVARAPSAA